MSKRLNIRLPLALIMGLILAAAAPYAAAQDISGYTVQAKDDVFRTATMDALMQAPDLAGFPVMDCSIEYLRRDSGTAIVYRRGPIALDQTGPMRDLDYTYERGAQPTTEGELAQKAMFSGGMIVDLPKPGETAGVVSAAGDMQYMMRVAVIPKAYTKGKLTAAIFIERAVVYVHHDTIDVHNSEVFSKTVQLDGNNPLNFALPAWELIGGERIFKYVPKSLEEDVLVTLETPHHFGFSKNYPDPFADKTRISYAVPTEARISLTVKVRDKNEVLDEGVKEPGIHHLVWNAGDVPDGVYTATLIAKNMSGEVLHNSQMQLHKASGALNYPVRSQPNIFALLPDNLRLSTESGLAYQFPTDRVQPLSNMFTHIGVRIGYQVSQSLELGVIIGEEAFHEYPAADVDVNRIAEYGGVVGMTYGFAGPYLRYFGHVLGYGSITQATLAFTHDAAIADIGYGLSAELFPQVDLFLIPTVTAHFRNQISTKLGFQYGLRARF